MIIVKVFWNTNAKGEWVECEEMNWDDMPQTWHGPFESYEAAMAWAIEFSPDDTDVYEVLVVKMTDTELDGRYLNDPKLAMA